MCWSMSSEVVQSRAGARAATEAVLVAEATPRALLRAQVVVLVVPEGSAAPRLALVVLGAAVALEVALVAEEVAGGASEAAIVEASEVASAAVVEVETDSAGAVVASATKVRTAMAHLTAPLLVLEDHEVGLVVAAAAVATTAVAVIVVETVIEATATAAAAVTGAEVTVTADPAERTTSRLVGIDTTIATVEAETATAAGTTRANVRTRAIATTTGARAGDTKSRSIQGALRRVCHRFTSHFFTLPSSSTRVRPRIHMDRIGTGG